MVDVERLRQIFEGTALERGNGAFEIRIRRHDDDRQLRIALLHLVQQQETRFAGHPDVGDEHLRLADRKRLQHFVRGRKRLVRNALARERLLEHPADRAIVVDDPHDVGGGSDGA